MPQTISWVPVATRLPDSDQTVMVANDRWSDPVWLGYHDGEDWYSVDGALLLDDDDCESEDLLPPTHWMPMPEPPQAATPAPLLLTAPRFHECLFCEITSEYVPDEDVSSIGRRTLFFVEHGRSLTEGNQWELCDLCETEWMVRHYDRTPEIDVHRGTADWSGCHEFFGFEEMPLVCVSTASHADYQSDREREEQTWLYCRTRAEWRAAWQIARIIAKNGNRADRFPDLLSYLPAWKLPGDEITVRPKVLNGTRCAGGPLWGSCDGCGTEDLVVVEPGTQWANCETCHREAVERRTERGDS